MSAQCEVAIKQSAGAPMSLFERYLTLWVFLCIVAGIVLGQALPAPVQMLGRLEIARVNVPVGLLIWVMIIPMLVKVDFGALHEVRQHLRVGADPILSHPADRILSRVRMPTW